MRIRQEVALDSCGWADIHVQAADAPPYFVEVKVRHTIDEIVGHLGRKYSAKSPLIDEASRLVVLTEDRVRSAGIESALRERLPAHLQLEWWSEETIRNQLRRLFNVNVASFAERDLVEVQAAIDQAKGSYAFGDAFANTPLQSTLLWHFSFWKLREMFAAQTSQRDILAPGLYRDVVTVFADLSSFSSYVRDTRDDRIVRDALTSFYSKTRHQVLNSGGMLYQFLGDGVVALFGLPEGNDDSIVSALECAQALLSIGSSVSHEWQRQIDQLQSVSGAHVGIAIGDLNIVPLRPFSRAHLGAIADSINTAARISGSARAGEIVVSNAFFQRLPTRTKAEFEEMSPVDARNIGRIQTWRCVSP